MEAYSKLYQKSKMENSYIVTIATVVTNSYNIYIIFAKRYILDMVLWHLPLWHLRASVTFT